MTITRLYAQLFLLSAAAYTAARARGDPSVPRRLDGLFFIPPVEFPEESFKSYADEVQGVHIKRAQPLYTSDIHTIFTDAIITCSTGFVQEGPHCVKTVSEYPKLGCKDGWSFDEESVCYGFVTVKANVACDPEFREQKGKCGKVEEAPLLLTCPPGYVLEADGCAQSTEPQYQECPNGYAIVGGICYSTSCGPGTNGKECSGKGCQQEWNEEEKCLEKSKKAPTLRCPPSFASQKLKDSIVCISTQRTEAIPMCTESYYLINKKCLKFDDETSREVCPSGYVYHWRGECVKYVQEDAVLICSHGFKLNRNKSCTKKLYSPVVGICPQGFSYDPGQNQCHKISENIRYFSSIVAMLLEGNRPATDKPEGNSAQKPNGEKKPVKTADSNKPFTGESKGTSTTESDSEETIPMPVTGDSDSDNIVLTGDTKPDNILPMPPPTARPSNSDTLPMPPPSTPDSDNIVPMSPPTARPSNSDTLPNSPTTTSNSDNIVPMPITSDLPKSPTTTSNSDNVLPKSPVSTSNSNTLPMPPNPDSDSALSMPPQLIKRRTRLDIFSM